jgi:hypothetical protein
MVKPRITGSQQQQQQQSVLPVLNTDRFNAYLGLFVILYGTKITDLIFKKPRPIIKQCDEAVTS